MRVERIHLDAGGFEEFFAGLTESKPLRTDRVVFTDGDRALSIVGDGPVTIEAIETRSDGGNQNQNQNISRLREALKQIQIVREELETEEEALAEFLERNVEESVDYAAEFLERKSEEEETIVTDGGVNDPIWEELLGIYAAGYAEASNDLTNSAKSEKDVKDFEIIREKFYYLMDGRTLPEDLDKLVLEEQGGEPVTDGGADT